MRHLTTRPNLMQRCEGCGTTAPAEFVACPSCHTLFHARALTGLAQQADTHEREGRMVEALGVLRSMLPLLPTRSTQAEQISQRIAALELKAGGTAGRPAPKWLAGFGAVGLAVWKFAGPLFLLLSKGKLLLVGLLKLPTLLTMLVSASLWSGTNGIGLGVLVVAAIYVHEMGHVWAFSRYGIAVSAPMFVPGLGAFVRGSHYPHAAWPATDVALSGPIWGTVAGVLSLLAGQLLDVQWVKVAAVIIAEMNLFNLIPVWQLDGNRALAGLSRRQLGWVSGVGLLGSLLCGSPMGLLVAGGQLVRVFFRPPTGTGERRALVTWLVLVVSLLVLRVVAQGLAVS